MGPALTCITNVPAQTNTTAYNHINPITPLLVPPSSNTTYLSHYPFRWGQHFFLFPIIIPIGKYMHPPQTPPSPYLHLDLQQHHLGKLSFIIFVCLTFPQSPDEAASAWKPAKAFHDFNNDFTLFAVVPVLFNTKDIPLAIAYLDDVIIFSKTAEEHLDHLQQVFHKLCDAELSMKLSKCHFFAKEIQHLGHVLSTIGIKPLLSKTAGNKLMKPPKMLNM